MDNKLGEAGLTNKFTSNVHDEGYSLFELLGTNRPRPEKLQEMKMLIAKWNLKDLDQKGQTLATFGAEFGRGLFIQALAEAGIDLSAPDKNGNTPLMIAEKRDHVDVIFALAHAGVDLYPLSSQYKTRLARSAAYDGDVSVIEALAKVGADLSAPDPDIDGNTPATHAAANGHAPVIKALAKARANLNAPNKRGETPATLAAGNGHASVIQALDEAIYVDLSAPNKYGETPLMIAVNRAHVCAIKALARIPYIDRNARDKDGETAATLAAQGRRAYIIEALAEVGADLSKPNKKGETAAKIAAANRDISVITALFNAGEIKSLERAGVDLRPLLDQRYEKPSQAFTVSIPVLES